VDVPRRLPSLLMSGFWPVNDGKTPGWCSPLILALRSTRGNVRKMFKRVCTAAGTGDDWTPRELRTSFVSLMSHRGVSIEEIARLVGHASTRTTEVVYRRELRPVITTGPVGLAEALPPRTMHGHESALAPWRTSQRQGIGRSISFPCYLVKGVPDLTA